MLEVPINIYVHCLILVTVLSAIFIYYISKVIKKEVNHALHQNISSVIHKLDTSMIPHDVKEKLKKFFENVDLKKAFNKDSPTTTLNNDWLFTTIPMVVGLLYLGLFVLLYMLRFAQVELPDMMEILKINIITFAFIGIVEYIFFTRVASKYIPVPPSLIARTFLQDVKNIL